MSTQRAYLFKRLPLSIFVSATLWNLSIAEETIVPPGILEVPDGLEVTVWAHSPDLRNPTNMDIDHAGRVWVAEGVNYRWSDGRDPKGDRIAVIEDTDGDGRADKSWTFVQEPELVAPLGVAVIDNRVYVSNAPDLIVYTDVDRNLVFDPAIDKREVLLTGFNGRNHDHALHSVTFGPDGLLYLNHGNTGAYITDRSGKTFRVGSVYDGGKVKGLTDTYGINPKAYAGAKSDDGHIYVGGFAMRLKPDGRDLEVIGYNFRNSYEQTVTSLGEVFQNDNDDPPACRTTYLLEYGNAGWFSTDGQRYWQADRRPGQDIPTAQWRQDDPGVIPAGDVYGAGAPTGIVFYEGDALGEEWRGLLLSCEAARNVVFGYKPEANGAGYQLERFNFLTSNKSEELAGIDGLGGKVSEDLKTFFRPSDVSVGPDGAIYVADWFDPRVGGHSDQDKTVSGTIYRIAPKGFKSVVPSVDTKTAKGLIAALKSPAINVRAIGFMGLLEKGSESYDSVASLLNDQNPYVRGRAVWLLAQLGDRGVKKVISLTKDDDPEIRSVAYQSLRRAGVDYLDIAKRLAKDESSVVRREVAVSMRDIPFGDSKDVLLSLATGYEGNDRTFLEAWGIGCTGKEDQVYELVAKKMSKRDPLKWSDAYAELVWRLTPESAVDDLAARVASKTLPSEKRLQSLTALAFNSSQNVVDALFSLVATEGIVGETAKWWLLNYRNTRYAGFDVNERLKSENIYDPDSIVVSASIIPKPNEEAQLSIEKILGMSGNAGNGAIKIAVCYSCHTVGDNGVEYGPDLTAWAKGQTREVAIRSIVDPSFDIAHGYGGREVVLKDGTTVHGLIESQSDPLIIRSMGGVRQMIPNERIQKINWYGRSLMLSADQLGLSEQDVSDIVEYLRAL